MEVVIRKGVKSDLPSVLDLIKELADFEKALHEVTLTVEDLEKDGFGKHPFYWFIFLFYQVFHLERTLSLFRRLCGERIV